MIIAIDLTYNPYGGSLAQILNILKYIQNDKRFEYIIFCSKKNHLQFEQYESSNVIFKISSISSLNKFSRIIWTQLVLPFSLLRNRASILFCPGNFSPIMAFTKKIQWIGTVGPFENDFYQGFSSKEKINLIFNKIIMILSALTSSHVIFESRYTRDLFINKYGFRKERSSVINLGRDEYFYQTEELQSEILKRYLGKRFLLSVSHLYPYKNLEVLFHSIKNIEDKDIICLIAGKFHTPEYQLKLIHLAKNLNIEERIHFIGGVSKEELRDLYSNCEILVFTSPFENFAYTLVEAMSCGSAIIASNTTAMPETCEDAVIYFNPYSAEELTEEINHLLLNTHVMDDYRKKALKRSYEINTYEEANIKTTEIIRNMILYEK
jgi:glycosyltransferase involved in cell wall biosynthesis|tara:strand:- start:12503 stop:13639 length:1137 start_codon:yes stop_codon:yes gene_type:complete